MPFTGRVFFVHVLFTWLESREHDRTSQPRDAESLTVELPAERQTAHEHPTCEMYVMGQFKPLHTHMCTSLLEVSCW